MAGRGFLSWRRCWPVRDRDSWLRFKRAAPGKLVRFVGGILGLLLAAAAISSALIVLDSGGGGVPPRVAYGDVGSISITKVNSQGNGYVVTGTWDPTGNQCWTPGGPGT